MVATVGLAIGGGPRGRGVLCAAPRGHLLGRQLWLGARPTHAGDFGRILGRWRANVVRDLFVEGCRPSGGGGGAAVVAAVLLPLHVLRGDDGISGRARVVCGRSLGARALHPPWRPVHRNASFQNHAMCPRPCGYASSLPARSLRYSSSNF